MITRVYLVVVVVFILSICTIRLQITEAAARTIRVPLLSATTKEEGVFGQPVINYFVQTTLGNPSKSFNLQFDVAFNELFVPHYSFNPFISYLHYSKGFKCKDSSTCHRYNKSAVITYQNIKLTGKAYEDVLTINGMSIPGTHSPLALRQQFLGISDASTGKFKNLPIDGFIGLGVIPQASSSGGYNLMANLYSAKYIDNMQFSMRFNPKLDSKQGGDLILGGVDTSLYQGQIYWHPLHVLAGAQWSLNLDRVSLGDQMFSCYMKHCQAILSSGLNEMYGPREDVRVLYSLLNTVHDKSGIETIDCRRIPNLPILMFFIDGIPHTLLPSNYIRRLSEGGFFKKEICYVAILPQDDTSTWLLGTSFLGAYYSIFDMTYKQVGFAALK